MLPIHSHHQRLSFRTKHACFQLYNRRFNEYLASLAVTYLSMPGICLPLFDCLEVFDVELRCGHKLVAVYHCENSGILIDYGGSGPAMLDAGVPAELLLGGEDAVRMGDGVGFNFCLPEVSAVEVEALHAFPQPIVQEGLVELHVAIHDALLQQLLQAVVVEVGRHYLVLLGRQAHAWDYFSNILHAHVDRHSAHQTSRQEAPHFNYYTIMTDQAAGGRMGQKAYNLNNVQ